MTTLTIIFLVSVLRYLPALFILYLILRPRPAVVTGQVSKHEDEPTHYPHYPASFAGV